MAAKKVKTYERIASPVEEYWEVPFVVIGDTNWFNTSFEDGALNNVRTINIGSEMEIVSKLCADLSTEQCLGIDTETMGDDKRSGLDPWRSDSKLLLFQIGTISESYIVQPDYVYLFKDILENKNIIHLLQNAVFDFKFLKAKYQIEIENIYDTMITEQVITAGRSGLRVSLADICRRYKPYRLISKDQRQEFINFKDRNYKFSWKMLYYAARDIVLLFPIMQDQIETLEKCKLTETCNLEFDLIPCTAMMELGGVYINQKTLGYAIAYWTSEKIRLEKAIIELYEAELKGKKKKNLSLIEGIGQTITIGGPAQKMEMLKTFGFTVENAQRETLDSIDHDVARMLAEYSGVTKITTTYGENLIKRVNPVTGRLHPEFNQLGMGDSAKGNSKDSIATGRYSSDFQQIPKRSYTYGVVTDTNLIHKLNEMRKQNAAKVT